MTQYLNLARDYDFGFIDVAWITSAPDPTGVSFPYPAHTRDQYRVTVMPELVREFSWVPEDPATIPSTAPSFGGLSYTDPAMDSAAIQGGVQRVTRACTIAAFRLSWTKSDPASAIIWAGAVYVRAGVCNWIFNASTLHPSSPVTGEVYYDFSNGFYPVKLLPGDLVFAAFNGISPGALAAARGISLELFTLGG